MDLATLGISVGAVAVLTSLLVQVLKAVSRQVDWLPTLSGGTTQLAAYLVAVLATYGLAFAGVGVEDQASLADAIANLALGLGSGLLSQGVYAAGKATLTHGGEV